MLSSVINNSDVGGGKLFSNFVLIRSLIFSQQLSYLLPDIQREVLNILMNEATERELLSLMLVCRDWSKYLQNHKGWINDRLTDFYVEKPKMGITDDKPVRLQLPKSILQQFGSLDVFSPKITYFLYKRS